jgi:hypothetical protein
LANVKDTPGKPAPVTGATLEEKVKNARAALDAHVREIVRWHFNPETGTPFWLDKAKTFDFNPLTDVNGWDDVKKFPIFEDDWLRGGPVRRWCRRASRIAACTCSRPAAPPGCRSRAS